MAALALILHEQRIGLKRQASDPADKNDHNERDNDGERAKNEHVAGDAGR